MNFDIDRAVLYDELDPPPWINPAIIPLRDVTLGDHHPVLITEFGGKILVFDLLTLIYTHTAQGELDNVPWLVSFCLICNAGACFSPSVDGKLYHFRECGLYDAMTLIGDVETNSVWHHITGECLHGELVGKQLMQASLLQPTSLAQVRETHPDALYVLRETSAEELSIAGRWDQFRTDAKPFPDTWFTSLGTVDKRLPRLEAGLGVWFNGQARFYAFRTLNMNNNLILDTLGGRKLLIYVEEDSSTPIAVFVETQKAERRGDTILLDNGATIRYGILKHMGVKRPLERPHQLFQRWYSFAILFPQGEIYAI